MALKCKFLQLVLFAECEFAFVHTLFADVPVRINTTSTWFTLSYCSAITTLWLRLNAFTFVKLRNTWKPEGCWEISLNWGLNDWIAVQKVLFLHTCQHIVTLQAHISSR